MNCGSLSSSSSIVRAIIFLADLQKRRPPPQAASFGSQLHARVSGMKVLENFPQESHSHWWRISPSSTNSDDTGATIQSPQCGQR